MNEDQIKEVEELKIKIAQSDALVLCKSELFLQLNGGDTIDSMYPCSKELALLIGVLCGKDVFFE